MIQSVAAAWLMTDLTRSHQLIALVQASTTLPIMLLALFAGAIADNHDRRLVMLVAQVCMLIASALLAILTWAGMIGPLSLLALTLTVGAGIGLRTTKGVAIPSAKRSRGFHQALAEPDCMACHSDHPRPSLAKARAVKFDHGQLKPESRAKCQTCHLPPRDNLHAGQISACSTCHLPSAWKPATFDHGRYFALDGDHNAACTTCHVGGNYKRYTCYGCHEHREARIIAEHREEGITRIDNCVRCHRSAHGEGAGEGEGEGD